MQNQRNNDINHLVYLEQIKSAEANEIAAFLHAFQTQLIQKIQQADLDTKKRLIALLSEIKEIYEELSEKYFDGLNGRLWDIVNYESNYLTVFLKGELPERYRNDLFEDEKFGAEQLFSAIRLTPFSLKKTSFAGKTYPLLFNSWSKDLINRVLGMIRVGYLQGQTNYALVQGIRGTRSAKYKDGIMDLQTRYAMSIARTIVQQFAGQTRYKILSKGKGIRAYEWVSTLDLRTSQPCRSLDGQIFEFDKGPVPPIHIGCRSTIIPVWDQRKYPGLSEGRERASMDSPVSAKLDYYQWLSKQNKARQDEVLGRKMGSIFRMKGMTPERFRKMNLDRTFQALSVEAMKAKHPDLFRG